MGVRAWLFGSRVRAVATAAVGIGAVVGVAFALGALGAPSVVAVHNAFGGVDAAATVVETDVVVHNPSPIGVRLDDLALDYRVEMNGLSMAAGRREGVAIGPGNATLGFTTEMRNERIPAWWVSHLRRGERTDLAVRATVRSGTLGREHSFTPATRAIETDVIGAFNSSADRPVNADAAAVEDPVAWINRTNATWGNVTAERTPIRVEFVVYNPKPYPLTVTELAYDVRMNDVAMGEGRTDRTYVVPPGERRTVEALLILDNYRLDEWWVSHLEADQTTRLRIDFAARIDAGAATVRVPLRGMTYEKTIETDFFGTKGGNGSNESADGADTDGTTRDPANATDGGGTDGDGTAGNSTDGNASGENGTDGGGAGDSDGDGGLLDETTTDGNDSDDGGLLSVEGSPRGRSAA
jgi:LEA14-like dessication related protein